MPRIVLLSCLLFAGCKNKEGGGATGATSYTFECEVSEPFDLPDIYGEIAGREHECEDGPMYSDDLYVATSFFLGEFHMDDCGNVQGREIWVLYPNPGWESVGGTTCEVVWDVTGVRDEPVQQGSYSLNLTAVLNEAATTCDPETPQAPYWDEAMELEYDVSVSGGSATLFFTGSGDVLGSGAANGNHVTYASDENCKYL